MSHPRISVFASSAKGNVSPIRILQGQATLQARTNHEMAVDPIHDLIVAPNPFAQALLFFRADAAGNEKPLRVIQGPKTLMGGGMDTDNVEIDPVNNEVYTTQRGSDSVLVFSSLADGDVAPIRVLHGPKTGFRFPRRVTVDPVNNLIAVISAQGILIFNRTDNGDVAPRCVISGPKTGLPNLAETTNSKAMLNPAAKKIIFGGGGLRAARGQSYGKSFMAIWQYGDCGDVPPLYRLEKGGSASFDLIPENKEIVMVGGDSIEVYPMPEAF